MSTHALDDASGAPLADDGRRWRRNLVFAAPADDPRARRPVDAVVLVVSLVSAVLLGWAYRSGNQVDDRVVRLFADAPDWLTSISVVVFMGVGVYMLVLVGGIVAFGRGRMSVARDMLIAAGVALAGIVAASYAAGRGFPHFAPEFRSATQYPVFPVARLAMVWAGIGAAGPFLSAPLRRLGRRLTLGGAAAAVVLAYGTVTSVAGALAIGLASSALVHLILGSGLGIPSRARITAVLGEAGVGVADLEYLADEPGGATRVRVETVDGRTLSVKVYGRDATDAAFAARIWRAMWYRGDERDLLASRRQLAEHEALVMLVLERNGVPGMRVVTGAKASTEDVFVASEWVDGPRLAEVGRLGADELDAIWSMIDLLHRDRVVHRAIDRDRIVFTADGPTVVGVESAELLASRERVSADVAQLIAATALNAGVDEALDAAVRANDAEVLVDALPLLQSAALPRTLQDDVDEHELDLDELRDGLAERLGVEVPEMAKLYRVSWGALAMVLLTLFAAYALIGSLTSIGLDTVADEFATATWGWVILAFLLAQTTNVGEYLTLSAVIGRPVPFGPTMMFRYAISFISLAVPSDAGAIAMSVRYQQKLGVPTAAALAQGPFVTIVSKVVDVVLLLITLQFVGRTIEFDDVDFGPVVDLVIVIVILVVIGAAVVLMVPKLRARVMPHIREGFDAVRSSITDPRRLGWLLGGTMLQKVLFAMTLSASVAAFGNHIPFASAVFVNTAVSLFVGLMPVPGGIGVGESALTAGLVIVGVPAEAALAAAITHRMVTAYLPPVFGWWTSRWLTRNGYL